MINASFLRFCLLCGLACLSGLTRLQAQLPPDMHFEHFTPSEGLSSAQIRSIVQDSFGFIWVGTTDGLNRFDGRQFHVYRHRLEDSHSLANNIVNALALDIHGRVWAGTNKGLCFFDYADGFFHSVDIGKYNGERFDRNRVYAVVAGRADRIWYSTTTELHLLDPNGAISTYPLPAEIQANINCLTEDASGRIWIGTNSEVVLVFDTHLHTFVSISLSDSPNGKKRHAVFSTCSIFQESRDSFLICTWTQGLQRIVESGRRFKVSFCSGFRERGDKRWIARAMCPSSFVHRFWVAANGSGLGLYDPTIDRFTQSLHHLERDETSLCSESINAVFTDNAGILWVGTDEGLDKYDTLVSRFSVVRIGDFKGRNKEPWHVVDLIPDIGDSTLSTIWLAVSGVGLVHYKLGAGVQHIYTHPNPDDPADNAINCLFQDTGCTVWLGGKQGLVRFDSRMGKFVRIAGGTDVRLPRSITAIIRDRRGRLWIGTYTNGLYCYTPRTGKWVAYRHDPHLAGSIPDDHIFAILEDGGGRIWAGTQSQGLCMLDNDKGQWRHFRVEENSAFSLPDNNVYALAEDRASGRLWIATENGLAVISLRDLKIHAYSTADGLCNNDVFAITMAGNGHPWLATNNGISDFDPNSGKFRNFYMQDGLPRNSFEEGLRSLRNGSMLLGFPGGLVLFNGAEMRLNMRPPEMVITACKILDKEYPLKFSQREPEALSLNYSQNMITFEFAALNFTQSKNNTYAYRLEGFDKDWVYCGSRSTATYTNLDGGNYIFRVKAANNDGIWNEAGTSLRLTVKPPFRKTWEFYCLVLAVMLAALYLLHRYRVSQLVQIQRVRADIARDLHDDIGSTLSSIFMMSRMGLKNSRGFVQSERPAELLGTISRASQQAMELMGDIVWSINPANDGMEQILIRMREFAAETLDASDINFVFDVSANIQQVSLSLKKRKELLLIFKEAVNNLAKHSGAKEANIRISCKTTQLELTVEDNGIGLESGKRAGGNGLRNMSERAVRLGASLSFDPGSCGGTIVRLLLPLHGRGVGDSPDVHRPASHEDGIAGTPDVA